MTRAYKKKTYLNPEQKAAVLFLISHGWSIRSVGLALRMSRTTIYRLMDEQESPSPEGASRAAVEPHTPRRRGG